MESPLKIIEAHPIAAGVGVFVVGIIILMMMKGGGSSGGSTDASLGQAYYAALAAQSSDSKDIQVAQISANAATNIAGIQTGGAVDIQHTWAATDVANTLSNNNAAMGLAPYATEAHLYDTLAEIASVPPITTTSSHGGLNLGLFSIGGGSSTSTVANPNATAAENFLLNYSNGNHAAH
jgi:hypothetical protein